MGYNINAFVNNFSRWTVTGFFLKFLFLMGIVIIKILCKCEISKYYNSSFRQGCSEDQYYYV